MAFSKHHLYPPEMQIISHYFQAYSYPGRLEIILKLQSEGPLCVAEILRGHPISRETFSGHLNILSKAHLIIPEERFPFTFYSVHDENVKKSEEALYSFFQLMKRKG